jgi:hypothetical protein
MTAIVGKQYPCYPSSQIINPFQVFPRFARDNSLSLFANDSAQGACRAFLPLFILFEGRLHQQAFYSSNFNVLLELRCKQKCVEQLGRQHVEITKNMIYFPVICAFCNVQIVV